MTDVLEIETAVCIELPRSQTQTFQGRRHGRSGQLIATQATWREYYGSQLPDVRAPWWAHRDASAATFSGTLWIDESLPCFSGHFPGRPILPGVAQIEWAVAAAAESFTASPAEGFAGMSRIKFRTPMLPGTWLQLNLTSSGSDVTFEFRDGDGVRTQGRLHYHA